MDSGSNLIYLLGSGGSITEGQKWGFWRKNQVFSIKGKKESESDVILITVGEHLILSSSVTPWNVQIWLDVYCRLYYLNLHFSELVMCLSILGEW